MKPNEILVEDNNVTISSKMYKGHAILNIELPNGFTGHGNNELLNVIRNSIQNFCEDHEIPEHEIFLAMYFFSCKNRIYNGIRSNYPEFFL